MGYPKEYFRNQSEYFKRMQKHKYASFVPSLLKQQSGTTQRSKFSIFSGSTGFYEPKLQFELVVGYNTIIIINWMPKVSFEKKHTFQFKALCGLITL